jgi:pimeloyl-ACP methyl ester carboxylesterase
MLKRYKTGVSKDSLQIDVDSVRLAVAGEGGPAVLCLHAIGHGGADYAAFAAAVKDRFEVIRIDWPGSGPHGSTKSRSVLFVCRTLSGVLEVPAHRKTNHHREFNWRCRRIAPCP